MLQRLMHSVVDCILLFLTLYMTSDSAEALASAMASTYKALTRLASLLRALK
jgi:hypothetical protein